MPRLETPLTAARRRAAVSLAHLRHHGHLIIELRHAKPALLAVAEDVLSSSITLRLRRQRELEQLEAEIREGLRTPGGMPLVALLSRAQR